jgi:hypothetical protein
MASDLRISGAATTSRSECDIRVNFNDLQKIIAASNDIGASVQAQFASVDGGTTWTQSSLPLQTGDSLHSDPAVDWTSDGTAWAITIGINAAQTVLKLRAYKSTDNGSTWTFDSTPSGTQTNVDREILWVDHSPTSPFKDQMYLTWHTGVPVQFARRTTGASAAWQTPTQVSGSETTGMGIGGDVKTNATGDVFVFWQDADGSRQVYVAKSTDGGVTFGSVVTIASVFAQGRKISIPADSSRMTRVLVSGGAWRTSTKDNAYAVWADLSGESGCTSGSGPGTSASSSCKARVWFSRSTDGGSTWSAPIMLNNQSGKNDQAYPHLAVDEADGTLVVVYYDTVNDPNRLKTDVFMQMSTDDGVTWTSATKVTSAQTDETASSADSGNQYGDYIGLSGYAGTFFPAWTDRRNGAREEIWSALVKLVPHSCAFIVERSTLGQDEIDSRRSRGSATVPDAFRVVVDGFVAADIGITSDSSTLPITSPIGGMTAICTGNTSATGNYGPEVQRFTFHYTLDFGATDTAFGFAADTKIVTLTVAVGDVSASADIELIKQPNPFILHGDPPWLSIDLRVFSVEAGSSRFGFVMGSNSSDASGFVQSIMAALNSGHGTAGGESFASLPTSEEASAVHVLPTTGLFGRRVFNFAVAKVHYIGLVGAANVRVFFRLFSAQTTNASFDSATSYRRAASNPDGHPIPLAGIRSGEYITIPCFAAPRVDTTATSMDQQTDAPNVQQITALSDGSEVDRWFGCWLDVNQPTQNVLPVTPPGSNPDGPFNNFFNPALPIQQAVMRNPHQCLIAEIAFDPVPIPAGKDPGNWDKLAQRNLAWSDIPNPGVDGSRRALDTFEIKATPTKLPAHLPPDELMIDWVNLPAGSVASIFLPEVDAAEALKTADRLYGSHGLQFGDAHTIDCHARGITYVPIPAASAVNYAGLLSVDLPVGVKKGQEFSVIVRQVSNATGVRATPPPPPPAPPGLRLDADDAGAEAVVVSEGRRIYFRRIVGAFQLTIPVQTRQELLVREERLLSLLLWIAEAIPKNNRWEPVFVRYLEYVRGRVRGLGGDPGGITPSGSGDGIPSRPGKEPPAGGEAEEAFVGKVSGLIFDRFGDFGGFRLDTEDGERTFRSHEHEIEDLAERAWKERILIAVLAERHEPQRPRSIVLLHGPRPFQG